MDKLESVLVHAKEHCERSGARWTEKRKRVLATLLDSEVALSAYELMDQLNSRFEEKIPSMSVYRILNFLQSETLVHKLRLSNKFVACSHITCKHDHEVPQFLICGNCQKVKEIGVSRDLVSSLNEDIKEAGYRMVSQQLEIDCLCEDCYEEVA